MITFSIVTATYKRLDKLKYLYKNLLNQKKKNQFKIEWVIIVEKKDIKTISFLKRIKDLSYSIVINKTPGRFSNLIRQGILNSKGDYVIIVGDDDGFYPKALQTIHLKIKSNKYPEILVGYGHYINKKRKKIRLLVTKFKKFILDTNSRLLLSFVNYYMCPSVCIKRNILKNVKFFPSNYSNINDYITWLQIRKKYKPVIVKKEIAYVGFEPGTISYSFNVEKYIFLWKIYLTSKNYFYLFPIKLLFSVILITINYTYRSFNFFSSK